ncbi:hypothetical protein BH10PLA2_BH10PLA2_12660 [soil metagenome]
MVEITQRQPSIDTVLASGGEEAMQPDVLLSPQERTERTGDFLLGLDRTNVPLGLVVGKWHLTVQSKRQDGGFVFEKASHQIATLARRRTPNACE